MTTYKPNIVLSTKEYAVVGTRPIRPDGADKVTGAAKYGADYNPTRLLYGAVLRSPHAHANIKSIDTKDAAAVPGVHAIVTHRDFPTIGVADNGSSSKLQRKRDNILASEKALYKGQQIAAVVADSLHIAEQAVSLIKVDFEVLDPVLTAPEGAKDGSPLLHQDLKTKDLGEQTDKHSNVATHFRHVLGDIGKGFAEADVVVEREFNTATVHQGYIEPHNATAMWNKDGRVSVWCSTQAPFEMRDDISDVLDLSPSKIRVIPMEIGGGFGGKINIYLEPLAAMLSRKTGRPVKLTMPRAAIFEATGPTSGSFIKVKIGATKDGNLTAGEAYLAYEAGAFPGALVDAGAECVFATYDIPNQQIDGYDVVVNKPKVAAYRAPGAPNAAFATESLMDELAELLHVDPLEFRLKNAAKEGTRRAVGPTHRKIGVEEVLQAMKDHDHWNSPLEGPNQGRGAAVGYWFNIGLASTCTISVKKDGTVSLVEGNPDIGGSRASIAMQAAEVLGIRAEDVVPTIVDTDLTGFTALTAGSRTTFATGWAAYEAAEDVKTQMKSRAAVIWDVLVDSVQFTDGVFHSKTDPELKMTFKELAGRLLDTGGPIVGRATVHPKGVGGSAAGMIVDVEVDPETGKVEILRVTAVQDAGKAIHPSYVEGQMQGGSVQGIGWALNEEYFYNNAGQMANGSFLDYRIPTSLDLPMIDTVVVEVHNPGHPFGVRGVGEASIVPPLGAVGNAIYKATGVRLTNLPMNPGAVLEGLWDKNGR